MKNIAYHIIINIGYVLSIPLAVATVVCLLMVAIHKGVYTLVNLAFDCEDPYRPLGDLLRLGKGILDVYSEFYNIF